MSSPSTRNRPPRIALIGAGKWMRSHHLPIVRRLEEQGALTIAGLYNRTVETARELSRQHGISRIYESLNELVSDESLDGVVVCVGREAVYRVLAQIAACPLPLLVEKPPGNSVEEATQLSEMIGDRAIVGFNRRFAPSVTRFRELLESSEPVLHMECQFTRRMRNDEHFVIESGIHGVDLIQWLSGPVAQVRVTASPQKAVSDIRSRVPYWDASLQFESGATAHMTFVPRAGFAGERYTAYAADRTIILDFGCHFCDVTASRVRSCEASGETITYEFGSCPRDPFLAEGFIHEYHAFLDLITHGAPSASTFSSACASLQICEEIEQR